MGTDVIEAVEKLPSPCDIKVHSVMCTALIKLVDRVDKIVPEIEAAKPRCSSGIELLCLLIRGIDNAKQLIQYCCDSSKLYLALKGNTILSRCTKSKNLLEQSLSRIQNMVPVMLASKVFIMKRGGSTRGRGRGRPPSSRRQIMSSANDYHENLCNTESKAQQFAGPQFQAAIAGVIKDVLPTIIAEVMNASRGYICNDSNGQDDHNYNINGNGDAPMVTKPKQGCSYKAFKGCEPLIFYGKRDAMATFQWIHEMEAVIEISGCTATQAVMYATHSFRSETLFWWDNVKQTKGPGIVATLTWNCCHFDLE